MINLYAIGAAGLLAFGSGYLVADAKWQDKWDLHLLEDARATARAANDALDTQNKITEQLNKAKADAKKLQDEYESDRIAAADTSNRLRDEIARHKAAAENGNTSTISISANAATDRLVLANVLERADAAAGALADYADRNRQSAINCNAEYNAIRLTK